MKKLLTNDDRMKVRELCSSGKTHAEVALLFGLDKRYIARLCRSGTRLCERCGAEFVADKAQRFCSVHCASETRKTNRRHKTREGYVYIPKHILSDEDKAFVPDTNPTVPEHRLIMARHIGRMLRSDEIVHHINGIKDDNRIENLIIVDAKEHGLAHASVWAELVSLRNRVNELERINASSN